jgi:hypothetical protein
MKELAANSVAELHRIYAAPATSENFDAAPAPTQLYCTPSQLFANIPKLT